MPNLNKFIGIGRLGTDPELRYTTSGSAVCSLRMCFTDQWKDKDGNKREETCWIDATVFGKGAEVVKQYVSKGGQLFIEGKLRLEEWEDKQGGKRSKHTIKVDNFQFVGGSPKAKEAQTQGPNDRYDGGGMKRGAPPPRDDQNVRGPLPLDEDLPFALWIFVPLLGLGLGPMIA